MVVEGLGRSFDGRPVLDGVDLAIRPGEFVASSAAADPARAPCCGPSVGSTPTTRGVLVPSRRSVVFQEPRLLPWARVLRNVTVGLPAGRATDEPAAGRARRGRPHRPRPGLARHAVGWRGTAGRPGPCPGAGARAAPARRAVRGARRPHPHPHARPAPGAVRRHRPAVLLVTHDVDEAILLADRALVLTDGSIGLDARVDVPTPRLRGDRAFGEPPLAPAARAGRGRGGRGRAGARAVSRARGALRPGRADPARSGGAPARRRCRRRPVAAPPRTRRR